MDLDLSNNMLNTMEHSEHGTEIKFSSSNSNEQYAVIRIPEDEQRSSKHSSRKQSKRRRKNSNHKRILPRIIVKPLPPPPPEAREWSTIVSHSESSTISNKPATMREVLASIPGFCLKTRKRSGKKLSTAAQLQQTREGCIDLETPDSILVNTNIRALLNKHTFSLLPPLYQYKLGQLLPSVDRPSSSGRLSSSSLNNEFFARACLEWHDSLSGGEFTPEHQQKKKTEAEKEKSKIDPWKLKHFEPFWGEKFRRERSCLNNERPSLKTTIKLRPTASITSSSTVTKIKKSKSSNSNKRIRSVGAVTRASLKEDDDLDKDVGNCQTLSQGPDLMPINKVENGYVDCQVDFSSSDSFSTQPQDDLVSTTPVDPLLLPDTGQDSLDSRLNNKLVLNPIEETNLTNDCSKSKAPDSVGYLSENNKRFSDDNDETYCNKKKIKFDTDYDSDNANFSLSNIDSSKTDDCSVSENCPSEETSPDEITCNYSEQEHLDTNSEDSKITSGIEYDDRSISSVSSLKLDCNDTQPDAHSFQSTCDEKPEARGFHTPDHMPCVYESECFVETAGIHSEADELVPDLACETAKPDGSSDSLSYVEASKEMQVQVESIPLPDHSNNVYDEHFKDAESLIMETAGLHLEISNKNDNMKFASHPNVMELSSYISETNVTAAVTMPVSQSPSPMMEAAGTPVSDARAPTPQRPLDAEFPFQVLGHPGDWSADARADPRSDPHSDPRSDPHSDPNSNSEPHRSPGEGGKPLSEDDDSLYREESDSSGSCHSLALKHFQRPEPEQRPRRPKGKEPPRARGAGKVPPGAVNLERSYQICQAVIQSSPNRDALRGQLRPPPALLGRPRPAPHPRAPHPAQPPPLLRHAPAETSEPCACELRAMVECRQCGAFVHAACLGAPELCPACLSCLASLAPRAPPQPPPPLRP